MSHLLSIRNIDVEGKRLLLRVESNAPLDDVGVANDRRSRADWPLPKFVVGVSDRCWSVACSSGIRILHHTFDHCRAEMIGATINFALLSTIGLHLICDGTKRLTLPQEMVGLTMAVTGGSGVGH